MRAIDISGLTAPDRAGLSAGAVPELRWVAIADLVIDDTFQRPIERRGMEAIARIAAEFSWGKFAPVVVSPVVGGKYALIDGQHRTHAACLCGFETVPAMVVVLSPTDQAASFAAINGNVTRISTFHVLKAALAAEVPWAMRLRDAVAAAGCELMTYHPSHASKRPGQVFCVQAVRWLIDRDRPDVITAGLGALIARPGVTAEHFGEGIVRPWLAAILAGGGAHA